MKPGIIIAAAGRAERYRKAGGTGNKLDALLNDGSVFAQTLRHARASNLAVHVVTRPENIQIQALCGAQQIPVTLIESSGLGESIAAGVGATPHWDGWLVHLADMPFVTPVVFVEVAQALAFHPLVRPCANAQPGHPVGFSHDWFNKLCQLTGDNGARELLRGENIHFINVNDVESQRDIDLPSQLTQQNENNHAAS
ncbi:nucleotidyltransferase family protein [Buttiauxella sp. WJP83]|uniref:nucleotidyltransferase family protein n=1 Tax=Buttiauxella sp. WJP83 TaxID=2986951 RepID=UPI0022DD4DD3|nr:nucleotidyltransferase family protein [Buttiauxella sp. WJP83]WBM72755.1 nucleotidyltransferase family protein [Buttiauxella sp. WJP83]